MSTATIDPATAVNHQSDEVVASTADSASAVHRPESDAALLKALDHLRTSFMTHFYDLITPLHVHHLNTQPGSSDDHSKDHLAERRIHPFVDMCERKSDYLADIEMPGVENKESITVQWTSSRTLLIATTISRPPVEGWDTKPADAKVEPGDKSNEEGVTWIASERRIGRLVRILFFPTDVDMKAVQVKLRAGLLRIKVPKRFTGFEGWKVQVE